MKLTVEITYPDSRIVIERTVNEQSMADVLAYSVNETDRVKLAEATSISILVTK